MVPFADTHIHLLAGQDDGPKTMDDAVTMCRMAVAEGVQHAAALAHQNPDYPNNNAAALREAAARLEAELLRQDIPLSVYPTGEIMLSPDTYAEYQAGKLLSMGDRKKLLLVEMPHAMFMDVLPLASQFRADGIRLVIAHTERYPELLHDLPLAERWFASGILFQISSGELAAPNSPTDAKALKAWAQRGLIHMLGSDAHNLTRRVPNMREGVATLARFVGPAGADRIAGIWGIAALQGSPLNPPRFKPKPKPFWAKWLAR